MICLFRPLLVVKAAAAQQNFVAVLLDDSRSMQIADVDGQPRANYVKSEFGANDRGLLKALSDRFTVRTFRFSSAPTRTTKQSELTFSGSQSRLGAALSGVRQELAGLPVAGLVMVSDGADTADAALGEALLGSRPKRCRCSRSASDSETLSKDIQVGRVATPKNALKGTTLMVDVVLSQSGFDGQKVTLDVEDEGTLVSTQQVSLPDAGAPASVPVRFTVNEAGPRVLRFRVSPQPGELVTENNSREALIDVRDRKEKILYFEGEPRFEYKFIRRAIPDGDNVIVTSLIRTADNKYLRQGVDGPDELVAGFPKTREELFSYRALIIGSLEAAALTGDQMRMIAEFVDKRGGGLLMLGGPRAFAEGGYAGTAVADVLPVVLERTNVQAKGTVTRLNVKPTRAGMATAVTQLGRHRSRVGGEVEQPARGDVGESRHGREARRDGAADRHGRNARRAADAGVSALRPRQVVCVPAPGLVGVADGRDHGRRRSDAREFLAAVDAMAGRWRSGSSGAVVHQRARRAGRSGDAHRERGRSVVRRAE